MPLRWRHWGDDDEIRCAWAEDWRVAGLRRRERAMGMKRGKDTPLQFQSNFFTTHEQLEAPLTIMAGLVVLSV